MRLKKLNLCFYIIIFVSQFGTVSAFAQSQTKCVAVLGGEVEKNWDDLYHTWEEFYKKELKPAEGVVLAQTKKWAEAVVKQLNSEGYSAGIKIEAERRDLKNYVPERWVVQIYRGTLNTWLGQQIERGTKENETDYYFDFFGLLQNNSHAAADYDGRTHIVLSAGVYKQRFDDYVDGISHEMHHAFNHMQLKYKRSGGFYAEVNAVLSGRTLTPEYPLFFNFDEIKAYLIDYEETLARLEKLTPETDAHTALLAKKEYYRKNIWAFMDKSIFITELAIQNLRNPSVREQTRFLPDVDHGNFTAHIPLYEENNSLKSYEMTVWLPHARSSEKSAVNDMQLDIELRNLLINLRDFRTKLSSSLPTS